MVFSQNYMTYLPFLPILSPIIIRCSKSYCKGEEYPGKYIEYWLSIFIDENEETVYRVLGPCVQKHPTSVQFFSAYVICQIGHVCLLKSSIHCQTYSTKKEIQYECLSSHARTLCITVASMYAAIFSRLCVDWFLTLVTVFVPVCIQNICLSSDTKP